MTRAWLVLLLGVIAFVYALRLGEPGWYADAHHEGPTYLFDESYTAFSAAQLAQGDPGVFEAARRYRYNGPSGDARLVALMSPKSRGEWSHPPGAPLAMSFAVRALGFHALSVRLVPLLAALASLLAVAKLADRGKLAAVLLLATDGYFFVFARTAMPHMLLASALVVGAALLDRLATSPARFALVRCVLAGACFGFAISVRWTAAPVVLAILVATTLAQRGGPTAMQLLSIVGAAAAVYMLTYSSFFAHGRTLTDLWALQRKMACFHSHIQSPAGQASPWYRWPFSLHGVVFGSRGGDRPWLCIATGNPVLWWLMPVGLVASLWRLRSKARRARGAAAFVSVAAVAAVWLPWACVSRSGLSYYLLPAAPFVAVMLSQLLEPQRAKRPWLYRTCLVSAATFFAVLYPVLAALPVSPPVLEAYKSALF